MLSKTRTYLGLPDAKWLLVFFGILLVGLVLRMFTLDHGLPWVVGADEGFEINRALKLGQGEIDLTRSAKGGLYYLLFIEYVFYYLFLLLTGKVSSPADFAALYAQDPSMFWILGRLTVLVLSVFILFMTYRIGQKFFNVTIGLIAMALLAVSPAMVQNTENINVDTPMTLLALVIVYFCLNAIDQKRINYIIWGAVLALAVITKLPAILLFIPMFIAYWHVNRDMSLTKKFVNMQAVYFGLSFLLVYAITNPAGVVVYGKKIGAILGVYTPKVIADPDVLLVNAGLPINLWVFYSDVLQEGFGLIALMAGLVGLVCMLVMQPLRALILVSFPLALFVAFAETSSTHLYYPRYMVPVYPFLALFAAFLIKLIGDHVADKAVHKRAQVIGSVIGVSCIVLVAQPLAASYQWATKHLKEDTRVEAMRWIEANVKPGTGILVQGNPIQRQSLVVPLENLPSNYDVLIEEMKHVSPIKTKFLELQKARLSGKRYDLHTFRHFEPTASTDSYLAQGVSVFIINRKKFAADELEKNNKYSNEMKESRKLLYRNLQNDERFEKVFDLSPAVENRSGPHIEIYKLKS